MPEIDVLLAVYNGMPYLPDAVESIRRQTHANWRLVIVNDGSTDATTDYLNRQRDDRRVVVLHGPNAGLGPALNRGLEICTSEFVARMDIDDIAHPARLQEQVTYLRSHPQVGLLGTQVERMGDLRKGSRSLLPCDHDSIVAFHLAGTSAMYHPALMCRSALLRQIGGYWNRRLVAEDWDMWLRMAEVTRLANLDRVLLSYRFQEKSLSGKNVAATRSAVAFAIDCHHRRRAGVPLLDYENFVARQQAASWWRRSAKAIEIHARHQYRLAVGEMLGTRPVRGSLRLGWAALCSPRLTTHRLSRFLEIGANWTTLRGRNHDPTS